MSVPNNIQSGSAEAEFEYIIVGGGTAGLTVAARLSEDASVRVLLVEAGGDHSEDPLTLTPGLLRRMFGKSEYDWNFTSVPQPTLKGRSMNQARGKGLGGSSAINVMMSLWPSRANIDNWEKLGNKGWSYDDLVPYLRKFGTRHPPSDRTRDLTRLVYHDDSLSGQGPVQMSFGEGFGTANSAWMDSLASLGFEATADPMSGKMMGAFQNSFSIDPATNTRSYAATAYYSAEVRQRKNLVVLTHTLARKIEFTEDSDGVSASGVQLLREDGSDMTVNARTEIILAAGALQTPQLLELSGLGNRALLENLGIPVLIDNPNVGEHLQDHPFVCQSFEVNDGIFSLDRFRDPAILQAAVAQYQASRQGPLGNSAISCAYLPMADDHGVLSSEVRKELFATFVQGSESPSMEASPLLMETLGAQDEPAVQHMFVPFQTNVPHIPESMADHLLPSEPENYVSIITMLNYPFSRGTCHITSPDINVGPTLDPRFMTHPADIEILARNIMFVERIVEAEPLRSLVFKVGGRRIPYIVADSLEKAKEVIRQRQVSGFHVCGTCAMLPKEKGGVVNNRLIVHGTKNLRVVDASVFPLEPLGNIQSVVYAVAEKAADLIKEDRKLGRS